MLNRLRAHTGPSMGAAQDKTPRLCILRTARQRLSSQELPLAPMLRTDAARGHPSRPSLRERTCLTRYVVGRAAVSIGCRRLRQMPMPTGAGTRRCYDLRAQAPHIEHVARALGSDRCHLLARINSGLVCWVLARRWVPTRPARVGRQRVADPVVAFEPVVQVNEPAALAAEWSIGSVVEPGHLGDVPTSGALIAGHVGRSGRCWAPAASGRLLFCGLLVAKA